MRFPGYLLRIMVGSMAASCLSLAGVGCQKSPDRGVKKTNVTDQLSRDSTLRPDSGRVFDSAHDAAAVSAVNGADTALKKMTAVFYTCPMHPQVHSTKPGKCPICGMDLVYTKMSLAGKVSPMPGSKGKIANRP